MFASFHLPSLAHSSAQECTVTFPYVETLSSPPFYSSACCLLPFVATPHERAICCLQFLHFHSVPGCVLPTPGCPIGIVRWSPFCPQPFWVFFLGSLSLSFLGCLIQLSAGFLLAMHGAPVCTFSSLLADLSSLIDFSGECLIPSFLLTLYYVCWLLDL